MLKKLTKKAQQGGFAILWSILLLAAVIIVWGIFQAFGAQVTGEIQDDMATQTAGCGLNATGGSDNVLLYNNCSVGYNISTQSLDAQYTLAKKQGTIALIGVVTIIIGLLMGIVAGVMMYTKYG